jgi:hypothetical protein
MAAILSGYRAMTSLPDNTVSESQRTRPRLRVGLILDEQLAPRWIRDLMHQLLCSELIEFVIVIFSGKPAALGSRESILFTLWRKFDKWTFGDSAPPAELRIYPAQTLTLAPLDRDGKRRVSRTEVGRVQSCNLDVLVNLGSVDVPSEFLSCAKYGIWSFHYGAYTETKGEIALFWNLNASNCTYELLLKASTADPRRDHVLCRRNFAGHLFSLEYNLTLDRCRRAQILSERLLDLYHHGWTQTVIESLDAKPSDARVDAGSLSQVTLVWFARSFRRLLTRICFRQQWVLAYFRTSAPPHTEHLELNRLNVVAPPAGQDYADPFPFEHEGRNYVFFERFSDNERGSICCAELHRDGTTGEPQPVLTRSYHISYPFLFRWRGDIYLLPETSENRTVEVYGAVNFPERWELTAVLLNNVTALDPTLLEHEGKLWLFASGIGGIGTEWSELALFFANSLFGEWCPHPKNPVVRDIRRARPAGSLFFQRGTLIRPSQDCSSRYGYAISLNRIETLSQTDYREVPLTTIFPDWMPKICATHTFNQQGGVCMLDGLRLVPRWKYFGQKLHLSLRHSRSRQVTGVRRKGLIVPSELEHAKPSAVTPVAELRRRS